MSSSYSLIQAGAASKNPGVLERLPAGFKFAALFVLSIVTYLIPWMSVQLGLLIAAFVIALLPRVPFMRLVKSLLFSVMIVGLVVAIMAWQQDLARGIHFGMRLLTLVLLAFAVTASTTFPQMLRVFEKIASPLRWVGVNTENISMAMALTVRFVPHLMGMYREVREAQIARGLERNAIALIVPLIFRTLKTSEQVAQALDARSFNTQERGTRKR